MDDSRTEGGGETLDDSLGRAERCPRQRPPRWRWRVLCHRPRLWQFWRLDGRWWRGGGFDKTTLLYVGGRGEWGTAGSPLLVLVVFQGGHLPRLAYEVTWYPADNVRRCAPRPLFSVRGAVVLGRLELWLGALVWPGLTYALKMGFAVKPRRK